MSTSGVARTAGSREFPERVHTVRLQGLDALVTALTSGVDAVWIRIRLACVSNDEVV
ncbi:hypothetical protein [Euzebya pacifica]|uniref:hypothetical protein n=1 Tax=Euzebya pacifica TaxID=1608957 RepID=UPI0030F6BF11